MASHNTSILNRTLTNSAEDPNWVLASVEILISICVIVSNGFVLFILIADRSHFTPFKVYIFNLMLVNVLVECVQLTADMSVDMQYPTAKFCFVVLYEVYNAGAVQLQAHFLITVNRVWAVIHPISYRDRHTKNLAICMISVAVIYCHAIALPGIILGVNSYRYSPKQPSCFFYVVYTYRTWNRILQFLLYVFPLSFIAIGYIYVAREKHINRPVVSPVSNSVDPGMRRTQVTSINNTSDFASKRTTPTHKSRSFVLLSTMTAVVVICWAPSVLYFTIALFVHLPRDTTGRVVTILVAISPVIDPFVFVFSFKDLRDATRRIVRPR